MITKLMNCLNTDLKSTFPISYQTAMNKFFMMVEQSDTFMVVELMENFISREKKSKTFTIVNQRGQDGEGFCFETALELGDRKSVV